MTVAYPWSLWENTPLGDKSYPVNFFRNRSPGIKQDEMIMYLHWHEHLEWIVMMEGHALFHIDSHPVEAKSGDILFVPPGGLHVGYNLFDEPVEYVSIVFNASLFSDHASDPLHVQYIVPYLTGAAKLPIKLEADSVIAEHIFPVLAQAINLFEQGGTAVPLIVKSSLYMLFIRIASHFHRQADGKKLSSQHSPGLDRFKQLIRYVETHYANKITVEQGARQVNLNPYHFCKTFKKLTGRTFIDYVNLCRMNEAERLLRETDLNVTEIALQVGCGNPNYFTKLYKQYKGVVPTLSRKQGSSSLI